ncbi:ATP-binding protein [Amaricoccus tamworthensis]|uniref:ATP-binding protein n=1 Tax=Amaricoccus tamworthensis TaxID=57002 RepID=UPI003C797268
MKQRDTIRITLASLALLTAMAGIVSVIFYGSFVGSSHTRELGRLENHLNIGMSHVASQINDARRHTLNLANSREIQGLVRTTHEAQTPAPDASTSEYWKRRVAQRFSDLSMNNGYLQVRFIGTADGGREIVRVERHGERVETTPKKALQRKAHRPYFRETVKLEAGQLYQSDIELNREHGRIQTPRIPVLRTATPVFDDADHLVGIVVVNIDARQLTGLLRGSLPEPIELYVSRSDGQIIHHPDPDQAFQRSAGTPYTMVDEFPTLAKKPSATGVNGFAGMVSNTTGQKKLLLLRRVLTDPNDPEDYHLAGLAVPANRLEAGMAQTMARFGLLAGIAILALGFFAAWSGWRPWGHSGVAGQTANREAEDFIGAPSTDQPGTSNEIHRLQSTFAGLISALEARDTQNEETTSRLQAVMDGMEDAIFLIDTNGRIEIANRAARDMFGYRPDNLIGRNVSILMPPPYAQYHDQYLRQHLDKGSTYLLEKDRTFDGLKKDGTTFPINVRVNATQRNGEKKFIGQITDISDWDAVTKMKSEFVSTVSHELRTPLSAMRGTLGLLLAGVGGDLNDKAKELVETASANCARLIVLINDILDIEKLEAGQMNLSLGATDLAETVETAVRECQGLADSYAVSIVTDIPAETATVRGDTNRLIQVISNFLSNACKFSPRGETVTVGVQRMGEKWRVWVQDKGPGVSEEFQSKIFQKFTQADNSTTRKVGGSGLGLCISKAIIAAHDGTISFETSENGSTFYFELHALEAAENQIVPSSQARGQMLIIHDDEKVTEQIKGSVTPLGFDTEVAHTVAAAKEILATGHYDVLVMDWECRDDQSIELFEFLSQSSNHRDIPVIAISRSDQDTEGRASLLYWFHRPTPQVQIRELLNSVHPRNGVETLRVLHVEDDQDHLTLVSDLLRNIAEVHTAKTVLQSSNLLSRHRYDVVILDQKLPDGTGLDLLKIIRSQANPPEVMIYSVKSAPVGLDHMVGSSLVKTEVDNDMLLSEIRALLRSARCPD